VELAVVSVTQVMTGPTYLGQELMRLTPGQRPFFALFSARFSMSVLAGFFLSVFFCCMPFAITCLP